MPISCDVIVGDSAWLRLSPHHFSNLSSAKPIQPIIAPRPLTSDASPRATSAASTFSSSIREHARPSRVRVSPPSAVLAWTLAIGTTSTTTHRRALLRLPVVPFTCAHSSDIHDRTHTSPSRTCFARPERGRRGETRARKRPALNTYKPCGPTQAQQRMPRADLRCRSPPSHRRFRHRGFPEMIVHVSACALHV